MPHSLELDRGGRGTCRHVPLYGPPSVGACSRKPTLSLSTSISNHEFMRTKTCRACSCVMGQACFIRDPCSGSPSAFKHDFWNFREEFKSSLQMRSVLCRAHPIAKCWALQHVIDCILETITLDCCTCSCFDACFRMFSPAFIL
jgi:hypothetical protein